MKRAMLLLSAVFALACSTKPRAVVAPSTTSIEQHNEEQVRRIRAAIAGRENEPAEQVFKNVQWLKGVPAGRFLGIMNGGYSRALGVTCSHCHVEEDFSSDDKRAKRAAREMAVMHRSINERLRAMQNLTSESDARSISCSLCHRGMVNPGRD